MTETRTSHLVLDPSEQIGLVEFSCISGKNLQREFFQELDRFLDIFKAKGGDVGCKLKKILQQKFDTSGRRTAVSSWPPTPPRRGSH